MRNLLPSGSGVRDLWRLNPAPPGAHRVALRAGISVAVPLLTVVLLARTDLAIYAVFGAFASLYGRNQVGLPRLLMQATAGAALVAAVALGATLAAAGAGAWALVAVGAVVAGVGSMVSTVLDWHPPGPLFVIFAFGTVAAAPGEAADIPVALGVSAASALFAVVVGNVGAVVRRTPGPRLPRPPRLRSPRSPDPLRYLVAVGVAGSIATASGLGHPWWAMVAAAAPLSVAGRRHQLHRAAHRIAGTVVGLVPAALLLLLDLDPVPLVLVVVALQIAAELLVPRNYALALLCITPMALLMGTLGTSPRATGLIVDRGAETAIGALVAVVLLLVERRLRQA